LLLVGGDPASDGSGPIQQANAPSFNALCDSDTGLWSQTITIGMTARLSEIDLQLLRRSPDIVAPVDVEIQAVDDAGNVTQTVVGHGSTPGMILAHRSQPGCLTVPLDAPISLLAGQKVAISPTSAPSASGACYEWPFPGLDVYAGG